MKPGTDCVTMEVNAVHCFKLDGMGATISLRPLKRALPPCKYPLDGCIRWSDLFQTDEGQHQAMALKSSCFWLFSGTFLLWQQKDGLASSTIAKKTTSQMIAITSQSPRTATADSVSIKSLTIPKTSGPH